MTQCPRCGHEDFHKNCDQCGYVWLSKKLIRIYKRDKATCWLCGLRVERSDASIDHMWSKKRRGKNPIILRLAHQDCNEEKADKDPTPYIIEEWLRRENTTPWE